tara:strand:+ start:386 stop:547 length:162 start_codon:yes stop_codon:yes gene_type:complete
MIKATDPHIPQFNFKGYPELNKDTFEDSPRILDEIWTKYKKQSLEIAGASALR